MTAIPYTDKEIKIYVNGKEHIFYYEAGGLFIGFEYLAVVAGFKSSDPLTITYRHPIDSGQIFPNQNGPVCLNMEFFVKRKE